MKVSNIKSAFEDLLQKLRWSQYELAVNCGISYSALKNIFEGGSVRVQEGTLRKIYATTGWDFRKDGDRLVFFKPGEPQAQKGDPQLARIKEQWDMLDESEKEIFVKLVESFTTKKEKADVEKQ